VSQAAFAGTGFDAALPARPARRGPRTETEPRAPRTARQPPRPGEDPALDAVAAAWLRADPDGTRTAAVVRETFDQLYDGQRTGRWDYDQLFKTEKTHLGTLLQINLQKELGLEDGLRLDYRIAGAEVDCKFSRVLYEWEIPREMYERGGELALVCWASDHHARFGVGVVRINDELLRTSRNRDGKRKLNDAGADSVRWLTWGGLIENTLLHLDDATRASILGGRSGQECVTRLFRLLPGRLINRATVLTCAKQDDCLKRVRDARKLLRGEGVVVFGHYAPHPQMAAALGLPAPRRGEFVSARLTPAGADEAGAIEVERGVWRVARQADPQVEAPVLPKQGRDG
jgi:hypothetical protein